MRVCRPVVPGCARCARAHPDFGRSVNPISTRGDRLCPPNYYGHTQIFRPSDVPVRWRFCKILWPSQNVWTLMNSGLPREVKLAKAAKSLSFLDLSKYVEWGPHQARCCDQWGSIGGNSQVRRNACKPNPQLLGTTNGLGRVTSLEQLSLAEFSGE